MQRRITDFYAERSGEKTRQALTEHYGIEVSLHAIQKAAARASNRAQELNSQEPLQAVEASTVLVAQVDGSMVPIVDFRSPQATDNQSAAKDRRKLRKSTWKEIRLATAHAPSRSEPRYGVALGSPFEVGCMLSETCRFEGMTPTTHIHGVSDGAPWIAAQFEKQFGTQHTFLIDYFHVCEYLGEASKSLAGTPPKESWYQEQKNRLKEGASDEVIIELKAQSQKLTKESNLTGEEEHPMIKAHRYLENRQQHLDYKTALEKELPIGSGEIESGHRSVLQARLKIAGAWWSLETAEKMSHLRVLRANGRWEELWQQAA